MATLAHKAPIIGAAATVRDQGRNVAYAVSQRFLQDELARAYMGASGQTPASIDMKAYLPPIPTSFPQYRQYSQKSLRLAFVKAFVLIMANTICPDDAHRLDQVTDAGFRYALSGKSKRAIAPAGKYKRFRDNCTARNKDKLLLAGELAWEAGKAAAT